MKHLTSYINAAVCTACLLGAFANPALGDQPSAQRLNPPLSFEANRGQVNAQVDFISRSARQTIFLVSTSATFVLTSSDPKAVIGPRPAKESARSETLRMQLIGAKVNAKGVSSNPLPGKVNYLIGSDSKKWHTNVPTYGKVRYENVYDGIDITYYGNGHELEYDFIVAPGADPSQIAMAFDGADKLEMDSEGNLVVSAGKRKLIQHRPQVYQELKGARHEVASHFALKGKREVRVEIAAYDHAKPLIIDPSLSFSTYLGGSGFDSGNAITVDGEGNVYVAGTTKSPDFPLTVSPAPPDSFGLSAFVTKFGPDGTVKYSTYLGDYSGASGIAVDTIESVYLVGATRSHPTTPGAYRTTPTSGPGDLDGFITKLDPSGASLAYSTYLGGTDFDNILGVALDSKSNACVVGLTVSTDFPTSNAFQAGFAGPGDAASTGFGDYFVAKLNATGSGLIYSTYLGGSGKEGQIAQVSGGSAYSGAIAVDGNDNAYVVGTTASTDFPTTNAFQPSMHKNSDCSGCRSAFLTKISPAGVTVYSTYLGGSEDDYGHGVAVSAGGEAYVTGYAGSCDFPFLLQAGNHGGPRAGIFVTKFGTNGMQLAYSSFLGEGSPSGIAVDSAGRAYVTGQIAPGDDFATVCAIQPAHAPNNHNGPTSSLDAFTVGLAPGGDSFEFATYLGGSDDDGGRAITVDAAGNVYVAGYTFSQDFPTLNALPGTYAAGLEHVFVAFLTNSPCSDARPAFGPFTSWPPCSLAPPGITCPSNIVTSTDPGQCSAIVNFTVSATAHVGTPTVVSTPASGSAFPKGITTVNTTVTDGIGRQASCSFLVTVNDAEKPSITCPGNLSVACSTALMAPVSYSATVMDNCDSSPNVTYSITPGSGFAIGTTSVACTATDSSGNQSTCSFNVTRAPLDFSGFLSPIAGADATGGSFASPLRTFKFKSTIPVKFTGGCGGSALVTGIHRLQVIKYTDQTTAGDPIDATPTDAATTGDEFLLTDTEWHFNLDTKGTGMSAGIWLLRATLSDGSQHSAWIQIK